MTTLQPITVLQKRAIRTITFSKFDEHTSPLFGDLNIFKFQDIVFLYVAQLMDQYYNNTLPLIFSDFFTPVNRVL